MNRCTVRNLNDGFVFRFLFQFFVLPASLPNLTFCFKNETCLILLFLECGL